MDELYKQNIIEHYKHPRNKGALENPDVYSEGVNALCGDKLGLCIIFDENDVISDVVFDGDGCAISIAAASMLTDYIKGKNVSELKAITPDTMYDMLGIDITAGRVNCALLAYSVLNDVLNKYEKI